MLYALVLAFSSTPAPFEGDRIMNQHQHSTNTPPAPHGYRLVADARHVITARDMVFTGGLRSYWMPARRAGEAGSTVRDSVALAVAVLAN